MVLLFYILPFRAKDGKKLTNLHQSLPHGPRLHQYTARAGGGPAPLRAGVGAVEPDPERGEDLDQRDEYAGGAE